MRPLVLVLVAACGLAAGGLPDRPSRVRAADPPAEKMPAAHADAARRLDAMRKELVAVNQDIWTYAELGLEEHRSAARLVKVLKAAGFEVKEGVSDMPTAFVASYGWARNRARIVFTPTPGNRIVTFRSFPAPCQERTSPTPNDGCRSLAPTCRPPV